MREMRLYFILQRHGDLVKIGVSDDPETRLLELSTGNPHKLSLLGSVSGSFKIETCVHQLLLPWCVRREWFRYHEKPVRAFIATAMAWGAAKAVVELENYLETREHSLSLVPQPKPILTKPVIPNGSINSLRGYEKWLRECGWSKSVACRLAKYGWNDTDEGVMETSVVWMKKLNDAVASWEAFKLPSHGEFEQIMRRHACST